MLNRQLSPHEIKERKRLKKKSKPPSIKGVYADNRE